MIFEDRHEANKELQAFYNQTLASFINSSDELIWLKSGMHSYEPGLFKSIADSGKASKLAELHFELFNASEPRMSDQTIYEF